MPGGIPADGWSVWSAGLDQYWGNGYSPNNECSFHALRCPRSGRFFSSDEQRCIMAVTNIPISKQGYKRLEEELARLKSERPAIIQAIKEAREEGDLRENAGYDAARERQGMAEARIKYIESRMALYQVVDLDKLSGDKVIFGSTVEVEDVDTEESRTYTILGPDEAEPAKGSISFLSPVGQALLGKEVGDEVSVDIPRGRVTYEIVDITFRGSSIFD